MDFKAIAMSSYSDLQELAGCVRGDAIHIKHFAEKKLEEKQKAESYQQKVQLLEETLQLGSKNRSKAQNKQSVEKGKPIRKATRKVTIGWLHFNDLMIEQSWLRWLVRGFRSERSLVRSSVTSTSVSTFLCSV